MHSPAIEAANIRQTAPKLPNGEIDIEQLVLDKGWLIGHENLKANKGRSPVMLLPMLIGGFVIRVDKQPVPKEKWEKFVKPDPEDLQRALVRYRVAKAIGQSLFYSITPNELPIRHSSDNLPSPTKEEKYCDQFAAALLVDPSLAAEIYNQGPEAVVSAANQRHVHTYAWLMAADQYQPVRAIAGWVRHNGEYLINKSSFTFNMDDGPMLWFTEPGIAHVLEANIRSGQAGPNVARHFLAFHKDNATDLIVESM
jgi:hypothetical protein